MAALALPFALLAVADLATAGLTGSPRALAFGLVDALVGLVAFVVWACSL